MERGLHHEEPKSAKRKVGPSYSSCPSALACLRTFRAKAPEGWRTRRLRPSAAERRRAKHNLAEFGPASSIAKRLGLRCPRTALVSSSLSGLGGLVAIMKRFTNAVFTLVELLVVIAIIAMLGCPGERARVRPRR